MTYTYKCINCNKVFEAEMSIQLAHLGMLVTCSHCECTAQHPRHHTAPPPVIKKGGGWTTKGHL